jgi:predicted HTH transcriptional regulator
MLVAQTDQRIYDEMRRDAVVRGLVREEVPEYPPVALRETLQDLVTRGLLEAFGRGRGTGYRLSELAMQARTTATLGEQLRAVLNHARRTGMVVNSDVRGLLGVGATEARSILEALVLRGLLRPEGERRGRRYLLIRQPEDER